MLKWLQPRPKCTLSWAFQHGLEFFFFSNGHRDKQSNLLKKILILSVVPSTPFQRLNQSVALRSKIHRIDVIFVVKSDVKTLPYSKVPG